MTTRRQRRIEEARRRELIAKGSVVDKKVEIKKPQKQKQSFFELPTLWPSSTVYILGGGPSLTNFDVNLLKGRRVIAVNNAYKLAPWIPVMYYGDCRWLQQHKQELLNFAGLKLTTCPTHLKRPGILVLRKESGRKGISFNKKFVLWNGNSGGCAVNIAVQLGAKKIVLLGFDMRKIDGECNWHREHPDADNKRKDPYHKFLKNFEKIADDLKRKEIECINATPDSALKLFPIVDPKDVI